MTIDIKSPKKVWNLRNNDSADTFFGPDFAQSAPNVRPIWMDMHLQSTPDKIPTTTDEKVIFTAGAIPKRSMRKVTGVSKAGNLTYGPLISHTSEDANGVWRWDLASGWDAIYRPYNFALDKYYNFADNQAVFLLRDGLTFRLTIEQGERYLAGEELVVSRVELATNRNGVKNKKIRLILAKIRFNKPAEWRPIDLAEQMGEDWHVDLFETDDYVEYVPTVVNIVVAAAPVITPEPKPALKPAAVVVAAPVDDSPDARYERALAIQRGGKGAAKSKRN